MMGWVRKLFHRDTGKVRTEAERENVRRECKSNIEAASEYIESTRKRREAATRGVEPRTP